MALSVLTLFVLALFVLAIFVLTDIGLVLTIINSSISSLLFSKCQKNCLETCGMIFIPLLLHCRVPHLGPSVEKIKLKITSKGAHLPSLQAKTIIAPLKTVKNIK